MLRFTPFLAYYTFICTFIISFVVIILISRWFWLITISRSALGCCSVYTWYLITIMTNLSIDKKLIPPFTSLLHWYGSITYNLIHSVPNLHILVLPFTCVTPFINVLWSCRLKDYLAWCLPPITSPVQLSRKRSSTNNITQLEGRGLGCMEGGQKLPKSLLHNLWMIPITTANCSFMMKSYCRELKRYWKCKVLLFVQDWMHTVYIVECNWLNSQLYINNLTVI